MEYKGKKLFFVLSMGVITEFWKIPDDLTPSDATLNKAINKDVLDIL